MTVSGITPNQLPHPVEPGKSSSSIQTPSTSAQTPPIERLQIDHQWDQFEHQWVLSLQKNNQVPATLNSFLEAKSNNNLGVKKELFYRFTPQALGRDTWMVAVVGMIFDKSNRDTSLLDGVVRNVISYLNDDWDMFFVFSLLKAVSSRVQDLSSSVVTEFLQAFQKLPLDEQTTALSTPYLNVLQGMSSYEETLQQTPIKPLTNSSITVPTPSNFLPTALQTFSTIAGLKAYIDHMPPGLRSYFALMWMSALFANLNKENTFSAHFPLIYATYMIFAPEIPAVKTTHKILPITTAIITHSSASLPQGLLNQNYIGVVSDVFTDIHHFVSYFDTFFSLGFSHLVVLMPEKTVWPYFNLAKHAAYVFGKKVQVLDTQTYGTGLRFLTERLDYIVRRHGTLQEILKRFENDDTGLQYWMVCSVKSLQKHPRLFSLLKKHGIHALKDSDSWVVLNLAHKIQINFKGSQHDAIKKLQQDVESYQETCKLSHKGVLIEHHQLLPEVQDMHSIFLNHSINSHLKKSHSYLSTFFGQHVSVCWW